MVSHVKQEMALAREAENARQNEKLERQRKQRNRKSKQSQMSIMERGIDYFLTYLSKRDQTRLKRVIKLAVTILYVTGLRIGEVCELKVNQLKKNV